jgi:hypothetical protein
MCSSAFCLMMVMVANLWTCIEALSLCQDRKLETPVNSHKKTLKMHHWYYVWCEHVSDCIAKTSLDSPVLPSNATTTSGLSRWPEKICVEMNMRSLIMYITTTTTGATSHIRTHYYINDFMRHCSKINGGGSKFNRLLPEDLRRRTLYLWWGSQNDRLANCGEDQK